MRWSEDLVGIEFSDDGLTAARVTTGPSGNLCLLNAGWIRVDPEAGDKEWASALRHLWRSAGMPTKTVCTSLRSRSLLLRYFRYPALDPVELASALGLEAEDSLQLPGEEIVLDWHLDRSAPVDGSQKDVRLEGLLVAAPRSQVQTQMGILKLAGLYPVGMDLAAGAVANLYEALHPGPATNEPVCLLHLTGHRADIALRFGEKGLYARSLYPRGDSWETSLGTLVDGVQDALKYYVFKLGGQPVKQVLVSGILPGEGDFLSRLNEQTELPVEQWNPVSRVVPGSGPVRRLLGEADCPPLEISLGLALRRYDDE